MGIGAQEFKRFPQKGHQAAQLLRPDLIPTHDPKLSEVEYGVASRSNFGGAYA